MRIVICDDEKEELHHLQALVSKFDSNIDVSLYSSSEKLLGSLKSESVDIVLLDIEMSGMNGFEAATKIAMTDNPPLVIFVTNSGEYVYRGYGIAFGYLPKPVDYDMLAGELSRAMEKIVPKRLPITIDGRSYILNTNDIIYVEAFGHRVSIYTKQESYSCKMRLNELESSLPANTFASPCKGYIVNLDYVEAIEEQEIMLADNIRVPISRRRKQPFEQALFRFVRRA